MPVSIIPAPCRSLIRAWCIWVKALFLRCPRRPSSVDAWLTGVGLLERGPCRLTLLCSTTIILRRGLPVVHPGPDLLLTRQFRILPRRWSRSVWRRLRCASRGHIAGARLELRRSLLRAVHVLPSTERVRPVLGRILARRRCASCEAAEPICPAWRRTLCGRGRGGRLRSLPCPRLCTTRWRRVRRVCGVRVAGGGRRGTGARKQPSLSPVCIIFGLLRRVA